MRIKEVAKEVVLDMMPKPGIRGVDLDTNEYEALLLKQSETADVDQTDLDLEVRKLLGDLHFGFSCLD